MITIQDENCNIMYSDSIPYIRIDLSGLLTTAQLIDKLSTPKLFSLISENSFSNILINMTQLWKVGTEELDWIENNLLIKLQEIGVNKVSFVTSSQIYGMFIALFTNIEAKVNKGQIEIHFFDDSQFYDGWEAVNWF